MLSEGSLTSVNIEWGSESSVTDSVDMPFACSQLGDTAIDLQEVLVCNTPLSLFSLSLYVCLLIVTSYHY